MRLRVLSLSAVLTLGSVAVSVADFSNAPVASPQWIQLGRFYLTNDGLALEDVRAGIDKIGFDAAAKVFHSALSRDPGSPELWSSSGEAYLAAGDLKKAQYCYSQAGKLAPHDPRILLNIGDFYSNIHQPALAAEQFSLILKGQTVTERDSLGANIFNYFETMGIRQKKLLDRAVPDAASAAAYMRYLMALSQPDAVRDVWTWAVMKGFDDDRMAVDYVNYLFSKEAIPVAEEGWMQHFGHQANGFTEPSAIFNGGFERPFTGGIPDWRFEGFSGVTAERDNQIRHAGLYSLRLTFSGNDNPDFRHFVERAFVHPGRYRLQGWARTAAVTSDEGVCFRVQASNYGEFQAATPALNGTADWQLLTTDFTVPPGTKTLDIQIGRRRSVRIDNQLTGEAWIDDVQLIPLH